jgi:hypothetical protein
MQWEDTEDKHFQQKIKSSTHQVPIVQRRIKVLGGMQVVTVQTWMACTRKENISRLVFLERAPLLIERDNNDG